MGYQKIEILYQKLLYPEVPDHPIPIRFVHILLNSVDNYPNETMAIGRAMGALLSDEVSEKSKRVFEISQIFQSVALHCLERHTLVDAVDEFISQIVAIPPGNCSTDARWTPDQNDGETV